MESSSLPLLIDQQPDGDATRLLSPDVGLFTCGAEAGRVLSPGESVGSLIALGQARDLVVPPGVRGTVCSERPERIFEPVACGQVLFELVPVEGGRSPAPVRPSAAPDSGSSLVLRSPQSGRFYHRAGPDSPPLVSAGDPVTAGTAIGLIEVMKTFTHVTYAPGGPLPERARILELLVADGADVKAGDPLVSLEAL